MKSLGSLLLLLLSSGQCYVHLSARKHRATSTTCITTSQHLGEVDADSECNLKCSLSCDMIVQTDVRQDKEAKRFLFLISEVEADCPGLQVSQLHLPVAVTVEGHQWGQEREAEPLWGFSPEAGHEVQFDPELFFFFSFLSLPLIGERTAKRFGRDLPGRFATAPRMATKQR